MPKVFALRARLPQGRKHRLDAGKIIETAKNLADDISRRLPGSSLAGLADELAKIAVATDERGRQARQPILAIYARGATGDSILRAVSEVEMLAIAITTKHLAKAEAVRGMNKELPRSGQTTEG